MRKKKGLILLEAIILINILLILIVYSSKIIASNSSKLKYYSIKEDIVSIDEEENEFLLQAETKINNDEDAMRVFILYKDDNALQYEYISSDYGKLRLEINEGILLMKGPYKSRYEYEKELTTYFYYEEDEIRIKLIPGNYKIYYMP